MTFKMLNKINGCLFSFIFLIIISLNEQNANGDVVVLNFNSNQEVLNICALKKPFTNKDDGEYKFVALDDTYDGCTPSSSPDLNSSSVVYLQYVAKPNANCQFSTVIKNMQAINPGFVLIGSDGPISINSSIINLTVSFVFMPDIYARKLNNFIKNTIDKSALSVKMVQDSTRFDYSLILIWLIASFTVFFGSLWTKHEFKMNLLKETRDNAIMNEEFNNESPIQNNSNNKNNKNNKKVKRLSNDENATANQSLNNEITNFERNNYKPKNIKNDKSNNSNNNQNNITTINVGWLSILVVFIFVVGMLLLLYYFFKIMIYFIYGVFVIGATSAFYRIGSLLFHFVNILKCRIPKTNLPYLRDHRFEIRKIILLICSLTFSAVWFVYRRESFAWILQDIMSLSLAANALSYYRLSSFKTVFIILVVFFCYDVFMVFVSPLFTNGTSIMEAVAFGGKDASDKLGTQDWNNLQFTSKKQDDTNRLPVVVLVPHLSPKKVLCDYYYDYPFTLLGLGDILIPGISVNYAIIFDLTNSNKYYPYFIVNILGYIIGLFLAFIGLLFMNTAQPALFYLCPIILIFSATTALIRKELKSYWLGDPIKEIKEINKFERVTKEASNNGSTNNLNASTFP